MRDGIIPAVRRGLSPCGNCALSADAYETNYTGTPYIAGVGLATIWWNTILTRTERAASGWQVCRGPGARDGITDNWRSDKNL